MTKLPEYGRGFDRMKARLGEKRTEELRLQVLKDQQAALSQAARPVQPRDRSSYSEYPAPKRRKKP